MPHPHCSICGKSLGEPIYASGEGKSLTSLCRVHPGETHVFVCRFCGHLQTSAIADVGSYYATEYDILIDSEEEDQIYEVRSGTTVYRTEHQVQVMLDKLQLSTPTRLLDHGCAKSSTIRSLCTIRPDVVPHAFDVSARYIPFWEKFIAPGNWAVNDIKRDWLSRFDVVTSFFSLEHIPTVADTMLEIASLLKPGGTFYCVVPNVLGNSADFIVIDHCNHFTSPSLQHLMATAGLRIREIDTEAHRGAFVVVADKPLDGKANAPGTSTAEIEGTIADLTKTAEYWRDAAAKVRAFEADLGDEESIAIYGAGFYGAFISASLAHPNRVACHLDQNPFLNGNEFNGRPILPPEGLPDDVRTLFVGLNPAHARAIITDIPALSGRALNYFFL